MGEKDRRDAVIIVGCRREQVLEIIEYIRAKFPDIEVSYEILREEIL